MKIKGTIFGCLLYAGLLAAQNNLPIEAWRTHFNYRDAHTIALTETGAYCAGANSLFFLDLEDNSLTRITKIDGLSETEIGTIAYQNDPDVLIITYTNGNIDLLKGNELTNVNVIEQTPLEGSKSIRQIHVNNNLAYLAAEFGLVVLDLDKEEIREAYTNIGANGQTIAINYSSVFNDSLFLATEEGVIAGSLDPAVNLQDFENWKRFNESSGIPETEISTIASMQSQVWATVDSDGIYVYKNGSWQRVNYPLSDRVLNMVQGQGSLLLTLPDGLFLLENDQTFTTLSDVLYSRPQFAVMDPRGLWVADSINGMVTSASGQLTSLFPSGPFSDSISLVFNHHDLLFSLPPGYDEFRSPLRSLLGINLFRDGDWINFNSSGSLRTSSFPAVTDLVDITFNSQNQKYYLASFGEGLLEWDLEGTSQLFDENTPGSTLENLTAEGRNVQVSSVVSDETGMVWATNYGNPSPIHRYNPQDGSWISFSTSFLPGRFPLDLQIAENGDFWLRLDNNRGGGILVFNPGSLSEVYLTDVSGNGGLPSREINDLAIDLNGQVWIATKKGIALYPFPQDILNRSSIDASMIFIDGRPLLRDEPITCIAIDGGNRKWIGTNNGLWLFSSQGDSVIYNFTEENSPLPSNRILDLGINQRSGEVFIITDIGAVSFRGTATSGVARHADVRIFPNPVTKDFNGLVGISGLTNNAIVKIADVTGKLVREFRAEGGTAVWDVTDFQGRRVLSGVYLVFSSSSDGTETFVGKIAVFN